jgi:hypothetical protein
VGNTAKLKTSAMAAFKAKAAAIKVSAALLVKLGLFFLVIILILAVFTMCGTILSGIGGGLSTGVYPADAHSITDASVLYTFHEASLIMALRNLASGIDPTDPYTETRVYLGQPSPIMFVGSNPASLIPLINHDPFELMAFLSAVYGAFTVGDVQATIQEIFDAQYQLTVETDVVDEVTVTTVTLIITPLLSILHDRMNAAQLEVFEMYMWSMGMSRFVASPFNFEWLHLVTSHFGFRVHPITGQFQMHLGIDVGVPEGTPLQSGIDGIVVFAGDLGGYGNVVMIQSADGTIEVRYAHMQYIWVNAGDEVGTGDIIGTVGNTGVSTAPHLHLEVLLDGVHVNPIFFTDTMVNN